MFFEGEVVSPVHRRIADRPIYSGEDKVNWEGGAKESLAVYTLILPEDRPPSLLHGFGESIRLRGSSLRYSTPPSRPACQLIASPTACAMRMRAYDIAYETLICRLC